MTLLFILAAVAVAYVLLSLVFTYLSQQLPRQPIDDPPDWGNIRDLHVSTPDGGYLETWWIEPDEPSSGIVLMAHGWGRNRDRMVHRARIFGRWGYTTVLFSMRDHGRSSPRRFMNAVKFAEDIGSMLEWIEEPVILYGHSAGAAGAAIAAHRHPQRIRLLFLEGCYAYTEAALMSLYRWFHPLFGILFGSMILFWLNLFYRNGLDGVSPARLAPFIQMPVLLIHGEKDRRFPVRFAEALHDSFPTGRAELFVAKGAGHSNSSHAPEYEKTVKRFLASHDTAFKTETKDFQI